jgi:tRNA isopentenyl-2-thiomethyl-A-37 hydroxylase MiaE
MHLQQREAYCNATQTEVLQSIVISQLLKVAGYATYRPLHSLSVAKSVSVRCRTGSLWIQSLQFLRYFKARGCSRGAATRSFGSNMGLPGIRQSALQSKQRRFQYWMRLVKKSAQQAASQAIARSLLALCCLLDY